MDISRDLLTGFMRLAAATPVERVALASALVNADWLIDVFVQEAREGGVNWSDIAASMSGPVSADLGGPSSSDRARESGPAGESFMSARTSHNGKYRPLWDFLRESEESSHEMSFDEVERVLGFPLPPSSRHHQPHWYGYRGSAVARAIIDAGWKAQNVDLVNEEVTFVRTPLVREVRRSSGEGL
jgi:hypothetical protein